MKKNHVSIWIFLSVFLASSMIFFDQAILPVALPSIQKSLSSSPTQIQWVINVYRLAIAAFVLAGGKLGDIFGLRRIFCLGMFLFAITSIFCGLSFSTYFLIANRLVQGIGAALVIPTLSPLLFSVFSIKKRGFIVGLKVSFSSVIMILASPLGGMLSQYLSWRYIFWINPIISFFGIFIVLFFVPKSTRVKDNFDFFGFLFFIFAIFSFSLSIMQTRNWGWFSYPIIILFFVSVILFSFLIFLEKQKKRDFIDISLFKNNTFSVCTLNILFVKFSLAASIFWPIFFQQALNFSPSKAGLFSMISFIPMLFAAPIGGKLVDKMGARKPLLFGQGLTFLSLLGICYFLPKTGAGLVLSLFLMGCGGTFALTPSFIGGLNSISQKKRGRAAGILNAVRSLGISLGIAILGSLLLNLQTWFFSGFLKNNLNTRHIDPYQFDGLLSHVKTAEENLRELNPAIQEEIISMLKTSLTWANQITVFCAAIFSLCMFVFIYKFMEKDKNIAEYNQTF